MDGNNFIGHEQDLSLEDPESRQALVRALCALHRVRRKPVTVVFDAPAPARGRDRAHLGGVHVLFAGGGRRGTADDRILRLVEEARQPSDLVVVTSDRSLGDRVRARGAALLRCHEFRRLLREALSAEEREKPTHVDVREWAAFFGLEDPPSET